MERRIEAPPLLSIVIATRNRVPYAISAIQSILEIPDPRLELVVQDNSDLRDLESYININIRDNRLQYRYTPPPFSMIDNFNAAVEMATGDYVCLIGDDDGVNPEIMEAAVWAKANEMDALTPKNLNYLWPATGIASTIFTRVEDGTLSVPSFSGSFIEADIKNEVLKLLHNGGVYYSSFQLPLLYHGLVHRRCLNEIRSRVGAYFKGLTPDIFAVLTIAEVASHVIFLDYPLIISGVCPGSGSTFGLTGKYNRQLESSFLFRDRGEYNWSELVPRIFTPETIWVDSAIAALCAMGRDDLMRELNLPKLAAHCIVANNNVIGPVLRGMFRGLKKMGQNPIDGAIQFTCFFLLFQGARFARRLWNRMQMIYGTKVIRKIRGLVNIVDASRALANYLKKNELSFSACVRRRSILLDVSETRTGTYFS